MKLKSSHVALLTPLERKVYRQFLTSVDISQEKKHYYQSLSHRYLEGDENVLPFPERSKKGVMLLTLCQRLKMQIHKTNAAVVMAPVVPYYASYVKQKLKALGADQVYAVPPDQLLAAIYGNGKRPFAYYRENPGFNLPGIDTTAERDLLCMINPPSSLVMDTSEYKVLGILLRYSKRLKEMDTPPPLHLFSEAAKIGLTEVTDLNDNRIWVSR